MVTDRHKSSANPQIEKVLLTPQSNVGNRRQVKEKVMYYYAYSYTRQPRIDERLKAMPFRVSHVSVCTGRADSIMSDQRIRLA